MLSDVSSFIAQYVLRCLYTAGSKSPAHFYAPLRHTLLQIRRTVMSFELWLGAIVAFGILVYLFAVLARPERY
jgi:K+-transporting ATPase KdpF subunit